MMYAEKALSVSEPRYRRLFETTQDGILILNAETGKITNVNPFLINILGYSKEQFIEKSIWDIGFVKDIPSNRDNFLELQQKEYIRYEDLPLQTADGRRIDVEFISNVYLVDNEKVIQCNIRDISEHMLAEKALSVSELRYRRLFETAQDGILILNAETGKITDVNPFLIKILGYSKEQFIEKTIWDIGIFKDIIANRDNFLELQQEEYIRYEDLPLQTADGRRIDVEFVSNVYLVDNEKVIQCNIRDISERKLAEKALCVSELRYRRLFETAQDGILILNAETGKITDVNPFLIKILGYSKEQFIEKTIWDIGIFKDIIANRDNFLELQQEEYIRYEDLPLQTADGRRIDVEFVSNVYLVDNEKVIQCDIRDITDRKKLETSLSVEKKLLEATLISVGDGVISCDDKGNVMIMNRVAELLTGWTQESAKGKPLEEVFNVENKFGREKSESIINAVFEKREPFEFVNHTILTSTDGIERVIEYNAAPIIEEKDEIIGIVLVFRDSSEKRLKEKEIEFISYHDKLTGLYNRRFYEEELKRLDTERNLPMTIAMGDVNGLKLINDSFGHTMGDELLKKVAEVIKKGCRADDILARLGGDEFIIILPKTNTFEAEQIIKRIMNFSLKEKVGDIDISISFGCGTKNTVEENIQDIFKNTEDNMYRHKLSESLSMRNKTITMILNTLYEKNKREQMHSKRVSILCGEIAAALGMDKDHINELITSGLMHDIGKIGIDEKILNKPQKLNNDEWNQIKKHPEIGYRILSSVNEFSEMANSILEHHERYDGTGYPMGSKGKDILLQASIIAIADSFDAMTSDRTYCKGLTEEDALEEIRRCSGSQFNPDIAKVFIEKVMGKTW